MTKERDSQTRGEQRERRAPEPSKMGVSGRSVRTLLDIIRRRGQQRSTIRNQGHAVR